MSLIMLCQATLANDENHPDITEPHIAHICLNTRCSIFPRAQCCPDILYLHAGPLCREFTGPWEFPTQRPVTRSFDIFFDLRLNNDWVNKREAGDLGYHRGHYDVNVMFLDLFWPHRHHLGPFQLQGLS